MKCQIPEISWHNRDPVLSVDFQPKSDDSLIRLASGGSDSHVIIWYVMEDGDAVRLELASDLTRHQKAVNCVRWSPNGKYLASCDDESVIFIWKKKEDDGFNIFDESSDNDKEVWISYKTLRGHMEDVYDLSFSPDSQFIMSGSVDNTAMIWDIEKAKSCSIIRDHKGFVQGVAWDPLNKYLATLSTDRHFRIFDVKSKKNIQRNHKSIIPVSSSSPFYKKPIRLFHDDTLQTFFRRLTFSPDGSLILVPSGVAELEGSDAKPLNTTYIYTRYTLDEPAFVLPSPDQYTVAVRFCPILFELRDSKAKPIIPLPYRMIFAVATKCSVYLYDTQQKIPFGLISNIHYTRLTDLSWSNNGKVLLVSSTDGYCSIVHFSNGELGEIYKEKSLQEIIDAKTVKDCEPKKKKKVKKNGRVNGDLTKSVSAEDNKMEVENDENDENEEMEVDESPKESVDKLLLDNLPESIKEMIPVDKIIKSNEIFSPEKQVGSPATPIQVRKCPRVPEELKDSSEIDTNKTPAKSSDHNNTESNATTPKASISSKTPNRIEIRRYPRTFAQINGTANEKEKKVEEPKDKTEENSWPKPIFMSTSPMERKLQQSSEKINSIESPKTPRRVEFHTIAPKSKKKLL
jgi:chromatin assembly factor 1 subunit B